MREALPALLVRVQYATYATDELFLANRSFAVKMKLSL